MAMTAEQKARAAEKRQAARDAKDAEALARQKALQAKFAVDFADDPVWNSKHELFGMVQDLIFKQGMQADEAAEYARNNASRLINEKAEQADAVADLADWLEQQNWSDFAQSLAAQYRRTGSLSEKQQNAGFSMREKVEARRATEGKATEGKATGLDISGLRSGYYAVPGGDTRLKVKVDNVDSGNWAGYIFVKDGAEYGRGERYGMQKPGEQYRGKIEDQLRVIMQDPYAAMVAYGNLVGRCGACNRVLEDEDSIAAGIGPICAQYFEG